MSEDELKPPIELRLAHLEQMVELFGKHTDIHMRSTSDMQKQIVWLIGKFEELQQVVGQQNETISTLLSALPLPPDAVSQNGDGS